MIGVVASGTDFMSKGFSVGSSVYWCRDFSRPGMDTDRPEGSRQGYQLHSKLNKVMLIKQLYH